MGFWAAVFFVLTLLCALLGFGGFAEPLGEIARYYFFIFLVLSVLSALEETETELPPW